MNDVALAKRFYGAVMTGDISSVLSLLSDSIEWRLVGPADIPYFGTYHGHDGVAQFFQRLHESEEIEIFEPTAFHAGDGAVIVEGRETCTARSTGRKFSAEWVHLFLVRDGKVFSWTEYIDTFPLMAAYRRLSSE